MPFFSAQESRLSFKIIVKVSRHGYTSPRNAFLTFFETSEAGIARTETCAVTAVKRPLLGRDKYQLRNSEIGARDSPGRNKPTTRNERTKIVSCVRHTRPSRSSPGREARSKKEFKIVNGPFYKSRGGTTCSRISRNKFVCYCFVPKRRR